MAGKQALPGLAEIVFWLEATPRLIAIKISETKLSVSDMLY